MFENRIFKINDDRYISYFEVGEGENVLFLIHGWLSSKESWIPMIQFLDNKEFRVIAVDLLGHGGSSRSLRLKFDTSENVSILAKFAMSLGVRNIVIVGHSLGGKISLFLANRLAGFSKTLVKKVIIVNSIGSYEFWRSLPTLMKVMLYKPIRSLIGFFTIPFFIKFYFKELLFLFPLSEEIKENISKYLSEYTSSHFESFRNKRCALRITKNLFDVFVEDIERSELPEVDIVWTAEDKVVPLQVQYKFSQLFKKPVYILSGAGHMSPVEIPDKLAKTVSLLCKT